VRTRQELAPLVLMGSEVPFPFGLVQSQLAVPGVNRAATHAVGLLELWGVPSRLASNAGIAGAHRGYITDLARDWLEAISAAERREVQVFRTPFAPRLLSGNDELGGEDVLPGFSASVAELFAG